MEIPLLIGVDEEGGAVNRISRYPAYRAEPFPSAQELYCLGGFEAIRSDTLEKCSLLEELGINLNLPRYAMCPRIQRTSSMRAPLGGRTADSPI